MGDNRETIVAVATARGVGGVGIVRLSGPASYAMAQRLTGISPQVRHAHYVTFKDRHQGVIDQGLLIYFRGPSSFTGEDVVECQLHGSSVLLDYLVSEVIHLGARMARPGEFTERAFLGGRINLAQAEAVADVIHAQSLAQAQASVRSLQGEFSDRVESLMSELTSIRLHLEAHLDFGDEDICPDTLQSIERRLLAIQGVLGDLLVVAQRGVWMQQGVRVALVGPVNVGKSSLFNQWVGESRAIVTEIPGTTRDTLSTSVELAGLPVVLVDTAGLRETEDVVEEEGIRRAKRAQASADVTVLLFDAQRHGRDDVLSWCHDWHLGDATGSCIVVMNKIDLVSGVPCVERSDGLTWVWLSVLEDTGLSLLVDALRDIVGVDDEGVVCSARGRHVVSLREAAEALGSALMAFRCHHALDILAVDIQRAHQALGDIVGVVTSDELLGHIFSEFCIGK